MFKVPITDAPEVWGGTRLIAKREGVEAGLFRCDPGKSLTMHAHEDGDEYIYLFDGSGTFAVGDEEFQVQAGELVRIPKGKMHRCYNTTEQPFTCFYLVCA
jgi:quercetin dioxygenase-like cupin family protein